MTNSPSAGGDGLDPLSPRSLNNESWARDALASLADGVVIIDSHAELIYSNPAARALFGPPALHAHAADAPDAPGRSWSNAYGVYEADETTVVPVDRFPLIRALAGETTSEIPLFIRNDATSGIHVLVSASPLRSATGEVQGAVSLFHDLTRQLEHEAQIAEGERQKMAILDNIPDIAWLKDRDGRFLAVNQPYAEAAGRSRPEDVLGLTDFEMWPSELAARYRADDEETMRSGLQKRIEEPLIDAKGNVRLIETFKTCIVGDRGDVIGTTGIARDITERKNAEKALRLSKDDLERRVEARTLELAEAQENLVRKERLAVLGQLAGGVAHQIRNPLAAIMNATYVLKRHLSPEQHPNVEDAIRIIHDEVRHANVIITGLLDYARVRTPDRHPTSIIEVLERVLTGDWIPESLTIQRAIEDVPLLNVDANQLQGAFFNVIRNALEAMPTGGILRVEVRATTDHVVIAFTDNGPGISSQVRSHLFEPLHSTKPMGIGLGLVTARTFIEAHGGRIYCVDVPEGARFEIRLPLEG